MFLKTVFSCVFIFLVSVSLFFVSLSCDDNGNNPSQVTEPDTISDPDTIPDPEVKWVGTFRISLRKNTDEFGKTVNSVNIVGGAADGPTLPNQSWTTVMTEGDCRLVVPRYYECGEGCGFGNVCVADNTCEPEPSRISIGEVTVSGVKTKDNTTTFSLGSRTPYLTGKEMAFPPFEDGGQVTFSVAGNSNFNIDPFTITGKGIAPIVLKNDTINYIDGKEITLEWEPSPQEHDSIFFEIDISYHGGTKAKILGETVDDGSCTISAEMLDKLKTYGIAGFPRLIIYRRATFKNEAGNVDLVIESEEARYLSIPGVISCNGICPEGMECGEDRICR